MHRTYSSNQERILQVAAGLFASSGYSASPVRDIASAAKVNEVTIFRQFKSKPGLFRATVDYLAQQAQVMHKLDAAYRQCDPNTPASIKAVIAACLEVCHDFPNLIGILKQTLVEKSNDQEIAGIFSDIKHEYIEPLRLFLADFSRASSAANGSEIAGLMIYGTLLSLLSSYLDVDDNSPIRTTLLREALAAATVEIWLNGAIAKAMQVSVAF